MAADDHARKMAMYAQFARVGKALANPARLELLDLLAQGERSVEDLAETARMKVSNTSAQLRALDDDERARVRGALDELLEERRSTGGLALETAVKIAAGVKPGG